MYKISRFSNELSVATHSIPSAFSVSVGVWFRVGSRHEHDSIAGISHLLEHMVFKGSRSFNADAIKRRIEGTGGQLNAFTSEEMTCYLAKVPYKMARQSLKILLDMAIHPRLEENDLVKEKTVIIEEIKMYNDLPQHMAQEQLDKAMWPNHPLGRSIAGSIESVRGISRQKLLRYKNDYYKPRNMVIVFCGNIKHEQALAYISDSIRKKNIAQRAHPFSRFVSRQSKPTINAMLKDIEQTRLAIGFGAYKRMHPKRFALSLLSVIVGGNMSSRLFDKIREKRGLAYSISCHYKRLIDTGALYIFAGLDNKKIDLALRLILQELSLLKTRFVPHAELKRAKEFVLAQLAMSLEDTLDHMVFLGESIASTNMVQEYDQIKKEVLSVTPNAIKSVAQDIFHKEKINISLVGPINDFEPKRCQAIIQEKLH